MNKLNQTFKINPLYESDGYKPGHKKMLAPGTTRLYGTWIPRNLKYMPKGITKIISAGQQLVVRYIHSTFTENFFMWGLQGEQARIVGALSNNTHNALLKEKAMKFVSDMSKYIGMEYDGKHFEDLWDLGYLPIKVKALPEGIFTKPNIPHMTFVNTVDGYAWLTLYLETMISKLAWQLPTVATISHRFKQNAVEAVLKTDRDNLWLADFMCHDFHSRGGNPFTSIAAGLGHAMSNSGSDTLNVIPASRYYYDFDENDTPIYSVNASEHSVTCTGIFFYDKKLRAGELNEKIKEYYSFDVPCEGSVESPDYLAIAEWLNLADWIQKFPSGILSIVSDTFDLWKLITFILPRLKKEILARDGKLVIRPDSGDPVDIICGQQSPYQEDEGKWIGKWNESVQYKGVIELLWDVFGGIVNEQGYKVLDSHIGCIYGDSINIDRQVQIYSRLGAKQYAATNVVLGIGSFSMVYITRDQAGYAAKGAWFEIDDSDCLSHSEHYDGPNYKSYNIYKDPVTDDGTKKSLKGLITVYQNSPQHETHPNEIWCGCEVTSEEENQGLLQTIYENGEFFNQTTLTEIRKRLNESN